MQLKLKFMELRCDAFSLDLTPKNSTVRKVIDPSLNIYLTGAFILLGKNRYDLKCSEN